MAAGDFLIIKNTGSTVILPNAGTNLDAIWDSVVVDEGSAASYSGGTFTFTNTAPYLITYTERFDTSDTTNNTRIEGQGRLRINGTNRVIAASEGYIRKQSGCQEMILTGVGIYNATAGDTMITRFYRGDTSASGTVDRVPGFGGVQILELDAADDFARYATTATNSITSTESDVANWTNDQEETGFSRSGNTVTITTAGRYLMTMSGTTSQGGSSRIGATVFAENGGVPVTGVRSYSHQRGADGNQNGALSFAAVIDVAALDTIVLRGIADAGTMTLDASAVWQFWQLPSGNETVIVEATNGNMNTDGVFAWDTLPHIDTSGFTATSGSTTIDVDQNCHALVFWTQGKTIIDAVQRGYPMGQIKVNDDIIDYAASGAYHRNSGGVGGFMAASGSVILQNVPSGASIQLKNTVLGATGTIDTEQGHLSIINLEGLYKSYSYTLPLAITDVDGDEILTNNQTNVTITGAEFGAVQGTGKVELAEFFNYTGTTVLQSVVSWSDTSIQINVSGGALVNTFCFLFVTTDDGSRGVIPVQVGAPQISYQQTVESMTNLPDHYWRFQNSYVDEIAGASGVANASSGGSPTFSISRRLVRGDSHSLQLDSATDYVSPADQPDMNVTIAANRRYVGGWIQLDSVSQTLSVIWEEGAQVNNFALLNGFGNNPIFQYADASGDYVQAYFDVPLVANRPYHILGMFNASGFNSGNCGVYLDGILQSRTDGNPWEVSSFPSHSGNISWGHEGTEDLKVGDDRGVDATIIEFVSPTACNYAHWYSWSDVTLDEIDDIKQTLFELGAPAAVEIPAGTTASIQLAIDALADTVRPNWPLAIKINGADEGDMELIFDNITFASQASIQVQYNGISTLTIVQSNGTSINTNKLSTPLNGIILIGDQVNLNITVRDIVDSSIVVNARVRLLADAGGVETTGTVLLEGVTNASGVLSGAYRYTSDQPVTGRVRQATSGTYYKTGGIAGTIQESGIDITIFMIGDE